MRRQKERVPGMGERLGAKVAAAKVWIVRMVRIGERLEEAQGEQEIRLALLELALAGPQLDADSELRDAVKDLLASSFLTADEMHSLTAAAEAADDR